MPIMNPYPLWTKYRQFQIGDLVQINIGNQPLGIIHGPSKRKYGEDARSYSGGVYSNQVNYHEYPVLISDIEETTQFNKWYWPSGHMEYAFDDAGGYRYQPKKDFNPLVAFIHPIYLIFLTEL